MRLASAEVSQAWEARLLREAAASQGAYEKLQRASQERVEALEAEVEQLSAELGVRRRNLQATSEAAAFEAARSTHELHRHNGMDVEDEQAYARRNQPHPNAPLGLPSSVVPPSSRLSRVPPSASTFTSSYGKARAAAQADDGWPAAVELGVGREEMD